jgi:hypothetical protein
MEKTLRFKKAIGIIAIILGLWRFANGFNAVNDLQTLKSAIAKNTNPALLSDMKSFVTLTTIYLPITMVLVLAIFIAGICLLTADKNTLATDPREKSRKINVTICSLAVAHIIGEIVYYLSIPQSVRGAVPVFSIIVSIGFVVALAVLCYLGMRPIPAPSVAPVVSAPNTPAETLAEPVQTLDTDILTLKKEIEKRKLEKELKSLAEQ